MKTTIETNDPVEAKRLLASTDMACAIFQIQRNLRKKLIYEVENIQFLSNEDIVEWVLDMVNEELEGINIDEILE